MGNSTTRNSSSFCYTPYDCEVLFCGIECANKMVPKYIIGQISLLIPHSSFSSVRKTFAEALCINTHRWTPIANITQIPNEKYNKGLFLAHRIIWVKFTGLGRMLCSMKTSRAQRLRFLPFSGSIILQGLRTTSPLNGKKKW